MARGRKPGDDAKNARRRFIRRAERLIGKALNETNDTIAERYRAEATSLLEQAAAGYESERDKNRFLKKYEDFGVTGYKRPIDMQSEDVKKEYEAYSNEQLESNLKSDAQRRDLSTKNLLKGPIGRRIYAATVNIWKDVPYSERDQEIMDFFGVSSMAEVIDIFEKRVGSDLYKRPNDQERYLNAATQGMILVQEIEYAEDII